MDKRFFICAAIILFFALLGLLAYNKLEIYSQTRFTLPSREALANNYFAMERWLNETGRPVRIETRYNPAKIAATEEKVVVALSSACQWENADAVIRPWIEQGGYIVISVDYDEDALEINFLEFLSSFGIGIIEIDDNENYYGESIPDFYNDIFFTVDNEDKVFTINDNHGNARLVEIPLGEGALTVISRPRFMYNTSLNRNANARLSWDLTGARTGGDGAGVLFIRDKYIPKALFGKIMEKGNLIPVCFSAFLLIFLGFWMVIPVFGLVFYEKQKTSRPIRERFTAEIRFLKKYGALNNYLEVYERELKLGENREINKTYSYKELIKKLRYYESMPEDVKWNSQI
jgi:hypothetical protein